MNKRRERPPLSDRGRRRALRTWGFYLLALTAWVTVVLAAVFLGYLVCSAFTWYAWDPLYQFLNWVRDYIVFVCMLVILLGWVAISYSFIARPMRLVDTLAAAAEQEESAMDGAIKGLGGWIACFEKSRLAGTVFAGGVTSVGEIQGHPALKKAYEMGRSI